MYYNERPIFQFSKFRLSDIIIFILYFLITVVVSIYLIAPNAISDKVQLAFRYAFITHFSFYGLCTKSLRNMSVLLVWILFGLVHLCFFYYFKNVLELIHSDLKVLNILRNTIPILLFFQFLRFVSLKIQHQDLVLPNQSDTELNSERKTNFLDYILIIIYSVIIVYFDVLKG
jgi:hypothetical protein